MLSNVIVWPFVSNVKPRDLLRLVVLVLFVLCFRGFLFTSMSIFNTVPTCSHDVMVQTNSLHAVVSHRRTRLGAVLAWWNGVKHFLSLTPFVYRQCV